jgi:hypothetical protein
MKLIAFLLVLMAALPARAEDVKIAVLPFDNAAGPQMQALADGMPDIIAACLTPHSDRVTLLERGMLEGVTAEQAAQYGTALGRGETRTAPGGLAAATHILRGSLAPHDKGFTLTLMLYALSTQALVASANAAGGAGEAAAVSCGAADTLAAKIPGLSTQPAVPVTGETADEEAGWFQVTEAMGFYYNGAYEKAVASFLKLSKERPSDGAMRFWLAKSYMGAGMDELAIAEFTAFVKEFPKHNRAPEARGEMKKLVKKAEQQPGQNMEKKP